MDYKISYAKYDVKRKLSSFEITEWRRIVYSSMSIRKIIKDWLEMVNTAIEIVKCNYKEYNNTIVPLVTINDGYQITATIVDNSCILTLFEVQNRIDTYTIKQVINFDN